MSLAFSPDSRLLACVSEHHLRVWHVPDQTLAWKRCRKASRCVFSGDSTRLVTNGGGTLQFWHAQTGERVGFVPVRQFSPDCERIACFAASPDGQTAVCGLENGRIAFSNGEAYQPPTAPTRFDTAPQNGTPVNWSVPAVAFSHQGHVVPVTIERFGTEGATAKYRCNLGATPVLQWQSDNASAKAYLSSTGDTALIWNRQSRQWIAFHDEVAYPLPPDFSASAEDTMAVTSGGLVATCQWRNDTPTIITWDLAKNAVIQKIPVRQSPAQLVISANRRYLALYFRNLDWCEDLVVLDLQTGNSMDCCLS